MGKSKYVDIVIDKDGTVEMLSNSDYDISSEFEVTRTRASWVEPVNWMKRWFFHAIRSRVSDTNFLANWTRRWTCQWQANVFDGPLLGPFNKRQEAIDAEVEWLLEHRLGI